ncbi:MAG: beta-lactamase family protein [Simkania negevensis]|nr:beta-lactamase family protein [Simkania negevensis]
MKQKIKILFFVLILFSSFSLFAQPIKDTLDQIEAKAASFVSTCDIKGLALCVMQGEKESSIERIFTFGNTSDRSGIPVNRFTEFKIGPLTQTFTSALLAYFVHEGRIALDDPISKYLPKSLKMPSYQNQEITFGDLATHTSALPNLPYSVSSPSAFNISQMYRFLTQYELTRAPGSQYEYSNLGYALLANLLMRISKRSFPDLVSQLLLQPLYLSDTTFYLSREQKSRSAIGYEEGMSFSPSDSEKLYSVFLGSNGLSSTAKDMLTFLSFQLGMEKTSLNPLLSIMHTPYRSFPACEMALGWKLLLLKGAKGKKMLISEGHFFGFSSYMGLIPEKKLGVVILSNRGVFSLAPLGEEVLLHLANTEHN